MIILVKSLTGSTVYAAILEKNKASDLQKQQLDEIQKSR